MSQLDVTMGVCRSHCWSGLRATSSGASRRSTSVSHSGRRSPNTCVTQGEEERYSVRSGQPSRADEGVRGAGLMGWLKTWAGWRSGMLQSESAMTPSRRIPRS